MDPVEPVLLCYQALKYYHSSEFLIKPHFRQSAADLIELKVRELFMQCGQISSRATGASLTEIDAPDYLAEFNPL
jgi:hypothetical protein